MADICFFFDEHIHKIDGSLDEFDIYCFALYCFTNFISYLNMAPSISGKVMSPADTCVVAAVDDD
eukprot:13137862-Ditylum_brightwellii.AAC.1